MVLIRKDAKSAAMRTLAAVAVLALLTGWATAATSAPNGEGDALRAAVGASAAAPQARAPTADDPPTACLASGGKAPTDSRDLLVTPLSQFSFEVLGPATEVRLVIALCSGANVGATVAVPLGCTSETTAANVIGLSNGQAVADIRCAQLGAGEHGFLLETGASAFSGQARAYGAKFA